MAFVSAVLAGQGCNAEGVLLKQDDGSKHRLLSPATVSAVSGEEVSKAYDGSNLFFKALRAIGWGPLVNLGFYSLCAPLSWLDVPASQVRLVRRALDLAKLQPGDRVLDVACGRGKSSHMAAQRVGDSGRVLGLDLLPQNVSTASWLYGDNSSNLQYVEGNAHSLHTHPAMQELSPNVIVCLEAAFHFERPAFLSSAARVLPPGGRLVLVDFNWREPVAAAVRAGRREAEAHAFARGVWQYDDFATEREYRAMAAQAGLAVVGVQDWTTNVLGVNGLLLRMTALLSLTPATRAVLQLVFPDLLLPPYKWALFAEACRLQRVASQDMRYMAYVFERV